MDTCFLHLAPARHCCSSCQRPLCARCPAVQQPDGWYCPDHAPLGERALPTQRERLLASAVHLCALLNFVLPLVGSVAAILVVGWLGGASPYVVGHTREALGFQVVYAIGLVMLAATLVGQLACLPVVPLLILVGLACNGWAAWQAWQGQPCRYPLTSSLLGI